MSDRVKALLVTVGGLGLSPKAPGTMGSIPPALLALILMLAGVGPAAYMLTLAIVAIAAVVVCVALGPWSERRFGARDPRQVVADEVAGMSVALMIVRFEAVPDPWRQALYVAVAFGLFRLLDIYKPGIIKPMQRAPAGWGIVLDDIAAGALAMLILLVGAGLLI